MKNISINEPVTSLVEKYPDLKNILKDIGFSEITNPLALSSVGKIVSIKKGAGIKNIGLDIIREKLQEGGFNLIEDQDSQDNPSDEGKRLELLKSYIERVSKG